MVRVLGIWATVVVAKVLPKDTRASDMMHSWFEVQGAARLGSCLRTFVFNLDFVPTGTSSTLCDSILGGNRHSDPNLLSMPLNPKLQILSRKPYTLNLDDQVEQPQTPHPLTTRKNSNWATFINDFA